MTTQVTVDELDARLAETAAALLKAILHAARARAPEDQETIDQIGGLTACRLTLTAVNSQIQIELVGNVEGSIKRFYGATFEEAGVMH